MPHILVTAVGAKQHDRVRIASMCVLFALLVLTTGCARVSLVSAPNLYVDSQINPYENVPPALQTASATILYATDRQSDTTNGELRYNTKRSRTVAFGRCGVAIGEGTSWEQLVDASRTRKRSSALPLSLTSVEERGHYPALPSMVEVGGRWVEDAAYLESAAQATADIHRMLAEELAKASTKEVYVFVHGVNNDFAYAATTTAQLWHFLGRAGVPVLYSWPAGSSGLLRGYNRDRESGEFTNAHLKQFIRTLASCPEVEKIHLISHSRGTDILTTALKELHIECRAAGKDTRAQLKLGQLILAAPDLDLEVFIERLGADRTGYVPERITIYVSPGDQAIGLSTWLFSSARRLGQLAFGDLQPGMTEALTKHPVISVVDVRAKTIGNGHDYFLSSPAALSDVILVLRDHKAPGAANGRPLDNPEGALWVLRDGYPNDPKSAAAAAK